MTAELDLTAIRARLEAATHGPWFLVEGGDIVACHEHNHASGCGPVAPCDDCLTVAEPHTIDAAEFVAAAPRDTALLLAEVDRLRARVAKLETEARLPYSPRR